MKKSYEGLHTVVTGAASGIGAATIASLAQQGARITALDVRPITAEGVRSIEIDLGDPAAIDKAVASIDGPIDALFNVAGVPQTRPAVDVMRVNVLGLRHLTEALLPSMPAGSAIANVASIAGNEWPGHLDRIKELLALSSFDEALAWCEANPDDLGDGYFFSKECVVVYTFQLSKRAIAKGVRVNSVSPGPVESPMMPDFRATIGSQTLEWTAKQAIGRMAEPREMVPPLLFLNHPESTYVNGLNLVADGGFTAAFNLGEVDFSALAG